MDRRVTRRTVLAGAGAAVFAGCTGLSDSESAEPPENLDSDWRQPGYDFRMRSYAPESTGPVDEILELWTVSGDASYTQPVVDDIRLFVGSEDGDVRAFDARNGDELWTVSVGGAASRPQVGEEYLYIATDEGIVALSKEGTEEWRIDSHPDVSGGSNPDDTVTGGGFLYTPHGLYVVRESEEACPDEDDSCPSGAGEGPTTAALVSRHDTSDGTNYWEEPIFEPLSHHLFASDSALFVSSGSQGIDPWILGAEEGRITEDVQQISHGPFEFCFSDGIIFGFDGWNGEFQTKTFQDGSLRTVGSASVPLSGEHLITDGERCYLSSSSGHGTHGVMGVSTEGEELWTHELDTVVGVPTVARDVVVYSDEDTVYGVEPVEGTELWTSSADGLGAGLVLVDDLLYTVDDDTIRAYRPAESD